jgi:uncharacterized protein YacL (UPF0231 family)
MEYQFTKNSLTGGLRIKCSMDHEVIGRWLEQEVGTDRARLSALIDTVEGLRGKTADEVVLRGSEISAFLSGDDVIVQDNALSFASDECEESGFDFYDSESTAVCGLEDFADLLHSLRAFLG